MNSSDMTSSEALNELAGALSQAQGEFPTIEKKRTGKVRDWGAGGPGAEREYKYADLADVLKGVLPILSKHKLAVLQPTHVEAGTIFVRTRLVHTSGQWIECEYPVCTVNVDQQKMGGALTYAKRYALCSLLGVAAEEDTDAPVGLASGSLRAPSSTRTVARGRPVVATFGYPVSPRLPPLVSKPATQSSRREQKVPMKRSSQTKQSREPRNDDLRIREKRPSPVTESV